MMKQNKALTISGWILTGLVSALLTFSAVLKLTGSPEAQKGMATFGYGAEHMVPIGITELACVLIYLFPRTSVLGAVLLTGYLGGATATHVRIQDVFFGPIVIGVLVWLALFLRNGGVRALLPIQCCGRCKIDPATTPSEK